MITIREIRVLTDWVYAVGRKAPDGQGYPTGEEVRFVVIRDGRRVDRLHDPRSRRAPRRRTRQRRSAEAAVKYFLIVVWLSSGQVHGQILQEFDGPEARGHCKYSLSSVIDHLVCLPASPAEPQE